MISLVGKPEQDGAILQLIPRSPLRGYPALDLPLYYGHRCPCCNNVIDAVFKTEKEIDLFPYEETAVINRKRELKFMIPATGQKDRRGAEFDTFYRSTMLIAGPWKAQRIVLLHHVLRYWGIDHSEKETGAGWFETTKSGDRACPYTGITTLKRDLLPRDLLLFSHSEKDLDQELPEVDRLLLGVNSLRVDGFCLEGTWIKAIGKGQPMVLVDRAAVINSDGFQSGFKRAAAMAQQRTPAELMKDIPEKGV